MNTRAGNAFIRNLESVQALVDFDRVVLDTAIANIERLKDDVDRPAIADRIGNTLDALRQIRRNDSMRGSYATIYNQCVVLLVSYFSSALHGIFIVAAPVRLMSKADKDAGREELKFTLAELREANYDLRELIGDFIVAKRDVSFQDMQSTVRAFRTYLGIEITPSADTHNIILAQAARHVIVHAGAVADSKFVRQVASANQRTLKTVVREREQLAFGPEEVEAIAAAMRRVVESVDSVLADTSDRTDTP